METRYRLASHVGYHQIANEHALLVEENSWRILRDPLYASLVSFLESRPSSMQEVIESLSAKFPVADLQHALHRLEEALLVTSEQSSSFSVDHEVQLLNRGINPADYQSVIEDFKLKVNCLDGEVTDWMRLPLEAAGVQCAEEASFQLWIVKDFGDPRLREINVRAMKTQSSWLLCKPYGLTPMVSPVFTPYLVEGRCWECLNHFIQLHDQARQIWNHFSNDSIPLNRPIGRNPAVSNLILSNLVLELQNWLLKGTKSKLASQLLLWDFYKGTQTWHTLVKRPQCPVCGDPTLLQRPPKPIVIQPSEVQKKVAGGYRTVSPEETLHKYQHLVSPITGVIPYLRPYGQTLHPDLHNFASGRNIALQSKSMFWLNMHLRSGNGGKGKSELQAKVGALCEAIERYCGIYLGQTYCVKGSLKTLPDAIHPNACMGYSENQIRNRDLSNEAATKFYSLVPIDFNEEAEMEWTPVFSLTEEKFKYLPTCFCYSQYPAEDEKKLYAYPDSNGGAAGNTLEEAILQGFLELVERDAAAIWWYNRLERPQVDLASTANPYIEKMINLYASMGRSLYVLDITTDLGIPVFVAISHRIHPDAKDEILYAFGAHLEAEIALERAIIELNQLLPIAEKIEGGYRTVDPAFIEWLETIQMKHHSYLQPASEPPRNLSTDYPELCAQTLEDAIAFCLETAQKEGLETLVLDLTQPDIGLPVVKVFVPGLRHFWRRTGPGRLYEVPVKMGWRTKEVNESALNPLSIFI